MKILMFYMAIIFPAVSYGITDVEKKIIRDQVRVFQTAKNPKDLITSKFKFSDLLKEASFKILKTTNITKLSKVTHQDHVVLTFHNERAKIEVDLRKIEKGIISFNGISEVNIGKMESLDSLWRLFLANANISRGHALLGFLLPYAMADDVEDSSKKEAAFSAWVTFNAVMEKFENMFHYCNAFRKLAEYYWKEHCDEVNKDNPEVQNTGERTKVKKRAGPALR